MELESKLYELKRSYEEYSPYFYTGVHDKNYVQKLNAEVNELSDSLSEEDLEGLRSLKKSNAVQNVLGAGAVAVSTMLGHYLGGMEEGLLCMVSSTCLLAYNLKRSKYVSDLIHYIQRRHDYQFYEQIDEELN